MKPESRRRVRLVKQRNWLIATATTLFVLQAPLCALACLERSEAATAQAHSPERPCHEEGSESTPTDSPNSHEDCGCELGHQALVPSPDAQLYAPFLAFASPGPSSEAVYSMVYFEPAAPRATDLPPPDILLLKSTLLI